nr:RHS repeat-associated core domain-containing protein [Treponema sp.]
SSYTYDAFGTLLEGELSGSSNYGYLGKQKDPTTNLYNYGYRDYKPASARFTTADPIRDGSNWFTYCNGDPVNFVNLWGLETGDNRLTNYDAVMRAIQGMDLRNGVPSDFIFENTIFNSSNTLNQLQLDKALGIQSDSRTTQSCQTTAIINAYAINLKNGISGKEIKKALMNKEGALIDSLDKDGSPIVLNEVSKALAKSTGNNMYLKSMDTKIKINGFMDISVGVILGYSKNNDTDSHFGYKNTYITIDSMDPNRPAAQNYTENTYRLLYWSNM